MRKLSESIYGAVDLGVVLVIGIAFAALMAIAYVLWTVHDQLLAATPYPTGGGAAANASRAAYNTTAASLANVTAGFDNAVNLLLVAITIFILAIAIAALLMLRGR